MSCPQPNCPYTTDMKSKLTRHMRVHSEKRHECTFCSYTTNNSSSLVNHIRVHTKETPFKCPEVGCDYQSAQRSHLKEHAKIHSSIKQFKCPFCNLSMKCKRSYRNHLSNLHGEDVSLIAPKPCKICALPIDNVNCTHLIDTLFQCPKKGCRFRGRTEGKVNGHQLTHSKEKKLKCPNTTCKFRTAHKSSLTDHLKLHEESPEKFYQCPLCPYKSRLKSCVNKHLKSGIHDGENRQRKFKCPQVGCSFSAFQKSALNDHLRIHNPEKLFKCPEPGCSYRANQKKLLKSHAKSHSEEKPWTCNLCPLTFRHGRSLSLHISRNHTKETPYVCYEEGCKFQAYTKQALTIHVKGFHWKIRPYKCPMCTYSLLTKSNWITHQHKIHGKVGKIQSSECTITGCEVVAKNEKELAIHFSSRHNLPRVCVSRTMV